MMGATVIAIACPKCGEICRLSPCDYEPSIGSFECACGIMGSASTEDQPPDAKDEG